MLEHLFGSQTRAKLLSLFLRHPDEAIFVREITRRIGTQINAVRRELSNLVRLSLIKEIEVDEPEIIKGKKRPGLKRKYYQIDRTFRLLPELTTLVLKAQVLMEQKLDKELAKIGDVRYLAFLGAFLGPAIPGKVDLFIVGQVDARRLRSMVADIEKQLGFEINYSLMTLDEFAYRKDITDRFLYAILEAPKNVAVDRLHEKKPLDT